MPLRKILAVFIETSKHDPLAKSLGKHHPVGYFVYHIKGCNPRIRSVAQRPRALDLDNGKRKDDDHQHGVYEGVVIFTVSDTHEHEHEHPETVSYRQSPRRRVWVPLTFPSLIADR